MKGYLRFPASTASPPSPLNPAPGVDRPDPHADDLSRLPSLTLGLAFAKAKRREAEDELAFQIARDAGEAIHATFTAPFSKPESAGPPSPASPPPSA